MKKLKKVMKRPQKKKTKEDENLLQQFAKWNVTIHYGHGYFA